MRIESYKLAGAPAAPSVKASTQPRPAAVDGLVGASVPGRVDFDTVSLSSQSARAVSRHSLGPLAMYAQPAEGNAAATRIVGSKLDVVG